MDHVDCEFEESFRIFEMIWFDGDHSNVLMPTWKTITTWLG